MHEGAESARDESGTTRMATDSDCEGSANIPSGVDDAGTASAYPREETPPQGVADILFPKEAEALPGDTSDLSDDLPSVVETASKLGMELPECLRSRYGEDAYFCRIIERISEHPVF